MSNGTTSIVKHHQDTVTRYPPPPPSTSHPFLHLLLPPLYLTFSSSLLFSFYISYLHYYTLWYDYFTLLHTFIQYSQTQHQLTTAFLLQCTTPVVATPCSYHHHQRYNHDIYLTHRQNLLHMVCHNRDIWKKKNCRKVRLTECSTNACELLSHCMYIVEVSLYVSIFNATCVV